MVKNKAQPPQIDENRKNKEFLDEIKNQSKNGGKESAKSKGYRSILNSETLRKVTQKASLLKKVPDEVHEYQVVKYGPG